jgi:CubicO group peptidase (beta-lactamase class C family)
MAHSSHIISAFLQSEIAHGSLPGAQYLVAQDQKIVAEDALGLAVVEPQRIPSTLDTIYDFASLTKPLITALLVVRLAERGVLDLDAPVAAYLSEFNDATKRDITLTELLTHTSGLPNWRPLYLDARDRGDVPAAIARILREPQQVPFSRDVVYSDLNYIVLGFVLESVTGIQLDQLARQEIIDPLGLDRTMFNPPRELLHEIAATEHGQEFELANALADVRTRGSRSSSPSSPYYMAAFNQAYWRKGLIWGEVHDGNANFMGGIAGHAGLFSTAREAFQIAAQFLPGSVMLGPESLKMFTATAGPALPPTAFGHNGFTGTSIWIDPHKSRVFVLLTNRVHPRVGATDMREIRRRFNSLSMEVVSGL